MISLFGFISAFVLLDNLYDCKHIVVDKKVMCMRLVVLFRVK